jgi:hypothetical protein
VPWTESTRHGARVHRTHKTATIDSLICSSDLMYRIGILRSNLKRCYRDGRPGLKTQWTGMSVMVRRCTLWCGGAIGPWRSHRRWLPHATDPGLIGPLKKNKAVAQGVLTHGSSAVCASSTVACDGAHSSMSSWCVDQLFQGVTAAKTQWAATADTPEPRRRLQIASRSPETRIPLRTRV